MEYPIKQLYKDSFPQSINELPQPPKELYVRGAPLSKMQPYVIAMVGARLHSTYGKLACEKIIRDLSGSPITIISGLAIGMDSIVHKSAIEYGLHTVAVLGSGLDDSVLYPATNTKLAHQILDSGGSLISETKPKTRATKYSFPQRNRLMASLSQLTVAVECEERSGTRITTRLANEYGKDVGAVPHNIFSEKGRGTNALIAQGAHIIRGANDIKDILGIEYSVEKPSKVLDSLTENEKKVYSALKTPMTKTKLTELTAMPPGALQATLATLEMKHLIAETMGKVQRTQ